MKEIDVESHKNLIRIYIDLKYSIFICLNNTVKLQKHINKIVTYRYILRSVGL